MIVIVGQYYQDSSTLTRATVYISCVRLSKKFKTFDTECKKVLGSSLLVVRFDYGVWCATFDLP